MKTTGKKNFRIIAACSVAIFSLLAVCGGVYSWFALTMKTSVNESSYQVVNVGTCGLYSIDLYKFNYMVHQYGGSEVVDYFNPESGSVGKYSYNKTLNQFGYYDSTTWHQVALMNTFDPVDLQLFGDDLEDLNCNSIYKFVVSSDDLTNVRLDGLVSKILDRTKQDDEIFLSSCTDFDIYFENDLLDSNPSFTDGDDHKMYYPSYIEKTETLTADEEVYYKISYLTSLKATHVNLYNPVVENATLVSNLAKTFEGNPGEARYLTIYVNVNYAPSELEGFMYQIYQRDINAVCDFGFKFFFARENQQ